MGKKSAKPRVIPEQDSRIIGTICMCQLTMVLSGVALVYLSVAVYAPSHRLFGSEFDPVPVICETVNTTMAHNCTWASCGEWCLTRTSGFCPQSWAIVRRNGSRLRLENCTQPITYNCPPAHTELLPTSNCNKEDQCLKMKGIYNCSLGHCANMSSMVKCKNHGEGAHIDVDKQSPKLTGFYECHDATCMKIKHPLDCERYCPRVLTAHNPPSVLVSRGHALLASTCSRARASPAGSVSLDKGGGGMPVWDYGDGALIVSCYTAEYNGETIEATDCINGTVVSMNEIPKPNMNFTEFRNLWKKAMDEDLHKQKRRFKGVSYDGFLPPSQNLLIFPNMSRLHINLAGCVNTLRGECRQFLDDYGLDGRNYTSRSRYPCYHKRNDSRLVLARFDLEQTRKELIVAIVVPSILFVISLTTLCIMTRSVKVGDDAKMRCLLCCTRSTPALSQSTPTPT